MRVRQNSSAEKKADDLVSKEWVFGPYKAYMYLEFDPSIHHIFGQRYEAKIVDNQFLAKGEYATYDKRSEWLPLNLRKNEREKVVQHIRYMLHDINLTKRSYQVGRDKLLTYFETHPAMAVEWDWMQSIPLGTKGVYANRKYIEVRYKVVNFIWTYSSHTLVPELLTTIYVPKRGVIQDRLWDAIKANNELIDFEIPQWVKDLGTWKSRCSL